MSNADLERNRPRFPRIIWLRSGHYDIISTN